MDEYIKRKDAILMIQRYGVGCFDSDDHPVRKMLARLAQKANGGENYEERRHNKKGQ